jgi:hypothetical protein
VGFLDKSGHRKSRCPGWIHPFRDALLADALPDPDGATDSFGNPKRVWNAVEGWYFIGVSTNQKIPTYNCYPEDPATDLVEKLVVRAARQLNALSGPSK